MKTNKLRVERQSLTSNLRDINNQQVFPNLANELIHDVDSLPFHLRNIDSAPDYTYVDMLAYNTASTTTLPVPLTLTFQRDVPFLSSPANEYELCVSRFSLDTATFPAFIPQIQGGLTQTNINLTNYSITMEYNGIIFQQYLIWEPELLYVTPPISPAQNGGVPDITNPYYQALNIQYLIILMQNTLNACFNGLNALVIAGGGSLPANSLAPIITYNTDSTLCSLFFTQNGYDPSINANPILVYFNSPMYGLFESFIYKALGSSNNGQNFQLIINSFNGVNTTFIPTTGSPQVPATVMSQSSSSVGIWNPIQSIVFVSNTLPINSTAIFPPQIFQEGQLINNNNSNSNVANVITSFQSSSGIYRPSISYEPTVYRFISLQGNHPLSLFQLQCYFRDKFGNLTPITLGSGQSFSMLVMLKRRNRY
jgi:hypothetical protein